MNEEYIDTVKHLIEQKDADKVKELLIDLHPADIAEDVYKRQSYASTGTFSVLLFHQ